MPNEIVNPAQLEIIEEAASKEYLLYAEHKKVFSFLALASYGLGLFLILMILLIQAYEIAVISWGYSSL